MSKLNAPHGWATVNLRDKAVQPCYPWDFHPENLEVVRAMPKEQRRNWIESTEGKWECYSLFQGVNPALRVSKDNQVHSLMGFAVDYDSKVLTAEVIRYLHAAYKDESHWPTYLERTLSSNVRLAWVFGRELLANGNDHAEMLVARFHKELKVATLLPCYDAASLKVTELWSNGGEWTDLVDHPLSPELVISIAVSVGKKLPASDTELPIEIITEHVHEKFPGRWTGKFDINAQGVRFWDSKADNPTGCQVKPDGMLCFTGPKPFMKWGDIFGYAWVKDQKNIAVSGIAKDTWYDGDGFWRKIHGLWVPSDTASLQRSLKASGLSAKVGRGSTISEVDDVIEFIATQNRVYGAVPLINYAEGLVTLGNRRYLNTLDVNLIPMADEKDITYNPEVDFPVIWDILSNFFDGDTEEERELALWSFLAWLQRYYRSIINHKPEMGQAVFFCGPVANGKTLISHKIVVPLLGDRSADPYEYFVGHTSFTDNLFSATILATNDESGPHDERERLAFQSRLKAFVVNPRHTHHPKFCKKTEIEWNGRILMTLNDDSNSLAMLPEVTDSNRDKMMFFRSRPRPQGWPERHILEAGIEKDLPKFARWLYSIEMPDEVLEKTRFGVISYYDPKILKFSLEQSPAHNLLEILRIWQQDGAEWADDGENELIKEGWVGVPGRLFSILRAEGQTTAPLLQGWTANRLHRALSTLANRQTPEVTFANSVDSRTFRIRLLPPAAK